MCEFCSETKSQTARRENAAVCQRTAVSVMLKHFESTSTTISISDAERIDEREAVFSCLSFRCGKAVRSVRGSNMK